MTARPDYRPAEARIYVRDIVSGLVPSDRLYNPIYDVIADYDLNRMTDAQWVELAAKIRKLRS